MTITGFKRPLLTLRRIFSSDLAKGRLHGSLHWIWERSVSLATLGLCAAALTLSPANYGCINAGLNVALPVHSHVGFSGIILDYLPGRKYPRTNKIAMGTLWMASLAATYGLYLFNTTDVGIVEGVRNFWNAKCLRRPTSIIKEDE